MIDRLCGDAVVAMVQAADLRRRDDAHREQLAAPMALERIASSTSLPTPVTSGQIILQSETAELYPPDIQMRPIKAIPAECSEVAP